MPRQLDDKEGSSLKLFVVLSKAYKTIMDRAAKDMKLYELSASEFIMLEMLYTKGRIPLNQIGEKILITSGSITYNIDKLENKGLLKRVPCKEDRRVIYAELSEAGKALLDDIFPKHAKFIHTLTQSLTQDEKLHLTGLLKKLGKGAVCINSG